MHRIEKTAQITVHHVKPWQPIDFRPVNCSPEETTKSINRRIQGQLARLAKYEAMRDITIGEIVRLRLQLARSRAVDNIMANLDAPDFIDLAASGSPL